MRKTLKKALKIVVFIIALALYLNIGYGLGTYNYNVSKELKKGGGAPEKIQKNYSQLSLAGKFFACPTAKFGDAKRGILESLTANRVLFSILWPFILLTAACLWLLYWLLLLVVFLFDLVVFLFKTIFLGGLYKLIFSAS